MMNMNMMRMLKLLVITPTRFTALWLMMPNAVSTIGIGNKMDMNTMRTMNVTSPVLWIYDAWV